MLKLSSLINENKGDNQPVKGVVIKIIRYLENKFGDVQWEDIYNEYEEDTSESIFEILTDTLKIPVEKAIGLYYLYVINIEAIRSGDESWKENPNRVDYTEKFSDKHIALSLELNTIPSLISEDRNKYYGLDQFTYYVDGGDYIIGNTDEVRDAISEYVENETYGLTNYSSVKEVYDSEIRYRFGERFICEFLYVPEGWKKEISNEDAGYRVAEMGDGEDLISELWGDDPETLELKSKYESLELLKSDLEDKINQTDNSEEIELYREKIDVIESELEDLYDDIRQHLYNYEYDNSYDMLTNNLEEWLEEYGYMSNGELITKRERGESKTFFPKFLSVDIEKMREELESLILEDVGNYFATYDGSEREVEYNGVTYYIYRV
jgi:hypothetical protein